MTGFAEVLRDLGFSFQSFASAPLSTACCFCLTVGHLNYFDLLLHPHKNGSIHAGERLNRDGDRGTSELQVGGNKL